MSKILLLLLLIILLIIFSYIYRNSNSKYWKNHQINNYTLGKNTKNNIMIGNIKNIKIKHELKNKYLKKYDIKEIIDKNYEKYINDLIYFFNNNYDDDIIFNKTSLKYLLNSSNPLDLYINLLFKNNSIIGSLIFKIVKVKILNKIEKIMIVDFGCLNNNYRGYNLFPHLINNALHIMKINNIKYAIHKKDKKVLPIKHHTQLTFFYYFIKYNKNTNLEFNTYPSNSNDLIYIYNNCQKIFNKFKISIFMNIYDFQSDFFNKDNQVTYWYKNPFIFFNGFFQKYKKENRIYNVFEIRYILFENNININLLKNLILYITKKYEIELIIYQDFALNNIMKNIFNFSQGHSTYVYILNLNLRNIKKEKKIFHF